MPYSCCVPGCKEKKGGHRFPKDPALNLQWRINVNRMDESENLWQPKATNVVCRDHFEPNCFTISSLDGNWRLKMNAVPTIFDFTQEPTDSSGRRKRRMDEKICEENEIQVVVPDVATGMEITTCNKMVEKEEDMPFEATEKAKDMGSQCPLLSDRE